MAELILRVDLGGRRLIGPGKVRLLELIDRHGSISAAGRAMGMSYRRAWLLVAGMNAAFRDPVVDTQHGGRAGGGAVVTGFGHRLIGHYRAMEAEAQAAVVDRLDALQAATVSVEIAPEVPADCVGGAGNQCGRGRESHGEWLDERSPDAKAER